MRYAMPCLLALTAVALTTLTAAVPAFGGIDDSWDWAGSKRVLRVWYNFDQANDKLGADLLKQIMDDAIDNWNSVKADTGWEFVKGGTQNEHDIEIRVGEITRNYGNGGAQTTGFPKSGAKDRTVSKLKITFDKTPEGGRLNADGEVEHVRFEWGANDDAKKNAVSAAKHELSHTIRLDHQGQLRSDSGKIKDGQCAETRNDDVTTISADDKTEAKKSSTAPIKTSMAPGSPGQDSFCSVPGFPLELPIPVITPNADLFIPGSAFLNDVVVNLSRTGMYSMPEPYATPMAVERMVKGVHIDITGLAGPPLLDHGSLFSVTIPYEDGAEGSGFLIDVGDLEYGPVVEAELTPFIYNPAAQEWQSIDPVALGGAYFLDTTNDFASISLPADLLYSFPNAGDPDTGTLFLAISGPLVPAAPNVWPVCCISAPSAWGAGVEVCYESCSTDADGLIVSCVWDLGDGAGATGDIVCHTYLDEGIPTVTLTVTDDDGATSTCTHDIAIPPATVQVSIPLHQGWHMISLPLEPVNKTILIDRVTKQIDPDSIFYEAYAAGNDPRNRLFRYQPCVGFWVYNPALYPSESWYEIGVEPPPGKPHPGPWWQGFWLMVDMPGGITLTYTAHYPWAGSEPRFLDISSCPAGCGWMMMGACARVPSPYLADVTAWPQTSTVSDLMWGKSAPPAEPTAWLPTSDCAGADAWDHEGIGLPLVGYDRPNLRYYSVSPPAGPPPNYCGAPADTRYPTPGEGYWLDVEDPEVWLRPLADQWP